MVKKKLSLIMLLLITFIGTVFAGSVTDISGTGFSYTSSSSLFTFNGGKVCSEGIETSYDFSGSTFSNIGKFNNVYYVEPGNASDIQAKIDLACNQDSTTKSVHIPASNYTINSKIIFCSNIEIYGDGWNTVLVLGDNVNDDMFENEGLGDTAPTNGSNVIISNMKLVGNSANNMLNQSRGIQLGGSHNVIISNMYITDFSLSNIYIGSSDYINVNNNYIDGNNKLSTGIYWDDCDNCQANGNIIKDTSNGISVRACENSIVNSNNIIGSEYEGIVININSQRNIISNNNIKEGSLSGIRLNDAFLNVINSNNIYSNEQYGINIRNNGNNTQGNTISNNVVYMNDRDGIQIMGHKNNIITGNLIYQNSYSNPGTYSGIKIGDDDAYISSNNIVSNNICYDNETFQSYGISEIENSFNNSFTGNICYNNKNGQIQTLKNSITIGNYDTDNILWNNFNVSGSIYSSGIIESGSDISPNEYIRRITDTDTSIRFQDNDIQFRSNNILLLRLVSGRVELGNTNNEIRAKNLTGTGNDYVCVDSDGDLYRSDTTCS